MDSQPEISVGDQDTLITKPERKPIDHDKIARLHILQGKPFLESAMAGGYTESSARKGLRFLMAESLLMSEAIRRAWEKSSVDITRLKPVVVSRLYREIAAPDSPNAMKAIELAGRFKETDWFVRNADVQLGVFVGMTERAPEPVETEEFKE